MELSIRSGGPDYQKTSGVQDPARLVRGGACGISLLVGGARLKMPDDVCPPASLEATVGKTPWLLLFIGELFGDRPIPGKFRVWPGPEPAVYLGVGVMGGCRRMGSIRWSGRSGGNQQPA